MVFSSILFILYFLPIFLIVYHLVGKKYKNYVLLISSIFFYSWGAPKFIFVILGTTLIDFQIVKWMGQTEDDSKRKKLLTVSRRPQSGSRASRRRDRQGRRLCPCGHEP